METMPVRPCCTSNIVFLCHEQCTGGYCRWAAPSCCRDSMALHLSSQRKQLAYAIANPTGQTISVKLTLVGQDGTVVDDTVTVPLGPGEQIARYLWQDLAASADFKGSVVLRAQDGATFLVVALVEKQGILTAIPVISGKAPGVPN